ncbi:MAG: ATP-dependent Clp protease proteolytic subunit [Candidatus Caenarcaniphilales bacterium]|nr:ATP-dependent Clp protease proteolytic subunit [Candidatus Caenarcaniphilales bacterium]
MNNILRYLPEVIETTSKGERKLDIVSRLMRERIIFIGEEIDTHLANVVCSQILLLDSEDPEKDITVYINSPGGSVIDGLAIYDTIQYANAPISTVCIGQAASMASVLLLAGAKGKRYGLKSCRVMIHQGSGGTQGQATDIEIYTQELIRLENLINDIMHRHTDQPIDKLVKDQRRDNYMSADEALEYRIIDSIV